MAMDKRGDRTWRFRVNHNRKTYTMNYTAPLYLTDKQALKAAEKEHMIFKANVISGKEALIDNITMQQLADVVYKEYVVVKLRVNSQKAYQNAYAKYIIPEFGVMNIKDIKPIHIQKFANKISKELKPRTVKLVLACLRAYAKYIIPEFGVMNIKDIKPIHIQKFANKISKELKPRTVKLVLACLRRTLSLAEKWEMIELNPYRGIQVDSDIENTNKELLSLDEIKILVNYYETEEKSLMHKLAFYIAIGCGLRNSEIRALTIDDFDFENNTIDINKQLASIRDTLMHKLAFYIAIGCGLRNSEIRALTIDDFDFENNTIDINKQLASIRDTDGNIYEDNAPTKSASSTRKIYASQFVMKCAKEYIKSLEVCPISKQLFFNHTTQKPILDRCLSAHFREVVNKLGLPPLRFHDLRHLQATLLINNGANVKSVSKRLGHSKTDITLNTYTSTLDVVDKQIAESFDKIFNNLDSITT